MLLQPGMPMEADQVPRLYDPPHPFGGYMPDQSCMTAMVTGEGAYNGGIFTMFADA